VSLELLNSHQGCALAKYYYTNQKKTKNDDINLKTSAESRRNFVVPKLQKYGNIYISDEEFITNEN
jgi:hypothetical protein